MPMHGFKPNPYDQDVADTVGVMSEIARELDLLSENVAPFDSVKLSPEEEDLLYDNPHLRYLGMVDPETQQPLTNAQAARMMLDDFGPQDYVGYVDDYWRRRARRMSGA